MIDDLNADYLRETLWHLDEPMTDLSTIPLFLVCREARRHVTVCLSGEGGDESYAGYDRFKASRLNRLYAALPGPVRHGLIEPLVSRLPDQPQKKGPVNMLKRFIEGAALPPAGEHLRWQYFSNADQDARLFNPDFRAVVSMDPFRLVREFSARFDGSDRVNREIYLDMCYQMPDSVLMKVDKMSMASSLEIRVPLLDHMLVEYLASLHGNWKLHRLQTKHVLRSALEGILPDRVVYRGKQGYSLPVKHLLRGPLRSFMTDVLNASSIIEETMEADHVNHLIQEHVQMTHNHNHVLWALLNVALWQERFDVSAG